MWGALLAAAMAAWLHPLTAAACCPRSWPGCETCPPPPDLRLLSPRLPVPAHGPPARPAERAATANPAPARAVSMPATSNPGTPRSFTEAAINSPPIRRIGSEGESAVVSIDRSRSGDADSSWPCRKRPGRYCQGRSPSCLLQKHCERSSKESRGGRLTRLRHAHQPGPSVHHLGGRNLRPPSRRGAPTPTVNQPEIGEFTDAPRSGELRSWPS